MTIEEITLELELAGLTREQQMKIISFVKTHGYDANVLDQKLRLMGYPPIFAMFEE